jgi:hypothetical protein
MFKLFSATLEEEEEKVASSNWMLTRLINTISADFFFVVSLGAYSFGC